MAKKYRVVRGLNYGPEASIRREAGDVVDDLPEASVSWLLEQGHVVEVEPEPAPANTPGRGRRTERAGEE